MEEKKDLKSKVKELSEQFEKGLEDLFQSDDYLRFLDVMAKRPNYSLSNNMLIFLQRPDATFVAGYNTLLNTYGHQVQQGEAGIKIFAPILCKGKSDKKATTDNDLASGIGESQTVEVENDWIRYKVVSVFDISQTQPVMIEKDGKKIISPKAQKLIDSLSYLEFSEIYASDEKMQNELIKAAENVIPIPIHYKELKKELGGYFSHRNKDELHIVLNTLYSGANTLETLVHEWAHYELHNPHGKNGESVKAMTQNDKEVQAESVAYIVLKHFGIDASCEALKYVASWSKSKTTDDLKKSMQIIQKTAAAMITDLEAVLNAADHQTEISA